MIFLVPVITPDHKLKLREQDPIDNNHYGNSSSPRASPVQSGFVDSFPLHGETRIDDHLHRHFHIVAKPLIGGNAVRPPLKAQLQGRSGDGHALVQIGHGHHLQVADISLYQGLKARLRREGWTEDDCRCGMVGRVHGRTPHGSRGARERSGKSKKGRRRVLEDWAEGEGVCMDWCVFEWGVRTMTWKDGWEDTLGEVFGKKY